VGATVLAAVVLTALLLVPAGALVPRAEGPSIEGFGLASPSFAPAASRSDATGSTGTTATEVWNNLTSSSGVGPDPRAAPQAAYDPVLGEVVLFGGFEFPLDAFNDTWAFAHGGWTELPLAGPSPPGRWGGEMVYDAADGYLLLTGGRNATQFFNDTWAFNATGWHGIDTTTAPAPRAYSGLTYDAADGYVLLFGGGWGNIPNPAGSNWTIYGDSWTYRAGVWTNITSTAGTGPEARLVGAMAYDAADDYVLLVAGSDSRDFNDVACPYIFPDEWTFAGGHWTPLVLTSPVEPPGGFGTLWYDSRAEALIYYDGVENLPGNCQALVGNVWTYASGVWQLAWSVGDSVGPQPRYLNAGVDDQGDSTNLIFGGYASFYGPNYGDTWALGLVRSKYDLSVVESGLPAGSVWGVHLVNYANALDPTLTASAPGLIAIQVLNGTYEYTVKPAAGFQLQGGGSSGSVSVNGTPTRLALAFVRQPGSAGPNGAPTELEMELGIGALGAVLVGGVVWSVGFAGRRSRMRQEGEALVDRLVSNPVRPRPPRSP
jgi:hypothetical protein